MVKALNSINPGVPGSKPLGGPKVDSAFHPSEFDKMSARNSEDLVVKSELSPCNGSVALKQFNTIHKKGEGRT